MSKLKIPKKVEMKSIQIHATNRDNHDSYLYIYGVEKVKTSLGYEEIDRQFKHKINLKFNAYGSKTHNINVLDSYAFYLSDYKMETFLTLFCTQKTDNLKIDYYGCNNSTMIDKTGLIDQCLLIDGDNHKIQLNGIYDPDNYYFTAFTYQNSGYTDYEHCDAIEI